MNARFRILVTLGLIATAGIGCSGDTGPIDPGSPVAAATSPEPTSANVDDARTVTVDPATPDSAPQQTDPATEAFRRLVKAHSDRDGSAWEQAEKTLDGLGAEAIPALKSALKSTLGNERELATMTLARLGPDALEASDALLEMLDDESVFVRANAASVLSVMQDPPDEVLQSLKELLQQPLPEWKAIAIVALRNYGTKAAELVPVLVENIASISDELRVETAVTLGEIGRGTKEAKLALQQMLEEQNESVREAARAALAALEAPAETTADDGDSVAKTVDAAVEPALSGPPTETDGVD